jgi:hypothetical protein
LATSVSIRTVWSRPSSPVTAEMPQSGLTTIRAKVRSVTSPQALIHSTSGFPVAAMSG